MRKQILPKEFLVTDYLQCKYFQFDLDFEKLIMFLQLLVFSQGLEYEVETLGNTKYRCVVFKIQDFLAFQKKSPNYYQYKKMVMFLDDLRKNTHLTMFSQKEFQSLAVVPQVQIIKGKTYSLAKVWFVEELFEYQYPFFLPDFFRQKNTKDELAVRVVFSSMDLEKKFMLQKFLEPYQGKISTQRIANMKRIFLELVELLKEHDLIETRY